MASETTQVTVRVPNALVARVKALAVVDLTQDATIYRRALKLGVESEEARLGVRPADAPTPVEAAV